ncbi:TPA: restriction endonuclease subunit S [Vibrio parahaemolyticus]|uniref:restriction endonuclease subunit S n=1 Tax=Vibrio parahaemolyticus TaxID=670 RepID=UPI0003FA8679|nr:restriction endonuclease subunit S [Vibrio parahaemolyticus]HCK0611921.1 restriction endonuclease subunit S [Vibrio parahaemolyticus]HCK0613734.1 restriction endonuclease subunit S [Vibrio parahaemolyticus]HCM0807304.1 restriction endonuclease subunit S [Vibrio parahaemolyticus]HCM0810064.1 restriction endonuclease subunit S [Vibrio parahaemolyticus]
MTGRYKAYAEYKDSGVEWVGSIPTHWGLKKLKYLAPLIGEKATEKTNPIALEHIQSWTGKLISSDSTFEGDGTKFKAGDILFGKLRPYLAKVYLTKADGEAIGDFHVMRPISNSYGKFLKSLMLTKDYIATVDASTYGAKMPRASWDFTSNIQLPFCSEVEAEKIANFLDHETSKIDTLIDKQEKLIELLKEKRQAVISHAVTKGLNPDAPMKDSGVEWLGEVPEHWAVGRYKFNTKRIIVGIAEAATHAYSDSGVPLIRSTNIKDNCELSGEFLYLKEEFADSNCSKSLHTNDVVTVRTGYPGVSAVVPSCLDRSQCFTNLVATPNDNNRSYFLANFLNSHLGKAYFKLQGWGSAQQNISVPILQNTPFVTPPIEEQDEICAYVLSQRKKFEQLISDVEKSKKLLIERKTALISAAVTGKIDVRDWQGEA